MKPISTGRAILYLAVWLLLVFLLDSVFVPRITPPGGIYHKDIPFIALVPLGSFLVARRYGSSWFYTPYGCLGAVMFLPAYLSGGRLGWRLWDAGMIPRILIGWCVFVVIMGLLCRLTGYIAEHVSLRKSGEGEYPLCKVCGYILLGLPKPRCPECGTPFSVDSIVAEKNPERSGES